MEKKSLLILMSTIMILILSLSGCGKEENTASDTQNKTLSDTVRIVTLTGAGEEATASLKDGFSIDVFQKASEIEAHIVNGNYDLAVVPANTAAKLYQQTGGDLVVISPISLNDWFIISNKGYIKSQDISDLRGETIVASGKGGSGEAILRKLLEDNYINPDSGVRMKWVDTPAQVMEALKETYTIALLQEPFATQALSLSSSSNGLTADIDLGALWETQYHSPVPSDVMIANKQHLFLVGSFLAHQLAGYQ
jgi:NitT/TauT family transport system substrate-binding protein